MNDSEPNLAIHGAPPTLEGCSFHWPRTSPAIRDSIVRLMENGDWGHYHGSALVELERRLAEVFGDRQASLCSSGTIGVELALRGVGAGPGDEVILAGYDFPGNFRAIEAVGAMPVLVDVVPGGWVLDPKNLEQALSHQTKAILVSHLHGQIADIPQLRAILEAIAPDQSIAIVEDACQCPGGHFQEQPLGNLGDVAVLSFGGSKLLSAGRGGAVLTSSQAIHQRITIFRERGNDAFPLSQLQAAVLAPQLDDLREFTRRRALAAFELIDHLQPLLGWSSLDPNLRAADACPAFYKLPLLVDQRQWTVDRELAIAALQAEGLPVGAGFRGFVKRSARRCRKVGSLHESQRAADDTILIHHPVLLADEETRHRAIEALVNVWRWLPDQQPMEIEALPNPERADA